MTSRFFSVSDKIQAKHSSDDRVFSSDPGARTGLLGRDQVVTRSANKQTPQPVNLSTCQRLPVEDKDYRPLFGLSGSAGPASHLPALVHYISRFQTT